MADKMPNVFILLGDRNSGKSRTIMALTGLVYKDVTQVATPAGNLDIFVQISSLQESGISQQKFIDQATKAQYQNLLVSLWISSGDGQPDGLNYIRAFQAAGWNISNIAILGVNALKGLPQDIPHIFIPDSQNMPANEIAHRIRGKWRWL